MMKSVPRSAASPYRFARRMSRIGVSAVREILKVTERPDIISFAGGLPAPELFPVAEIARAHERVFAEEGRAALQYSTTEGWLPLRRWIAERAAARGLRATADQVLITSGSQQCIDLVAKVFIEPGDKVIVENPCYIAALQAFGAFEAEFIAVGSDAEGMRVDEVEQALEKHDARLIYVVSNFSNPKGTTLSGARRRQLVELAKRFGVPIIDDDPYGELRFRGEFEPLLPSLDDAGMVVYLSTFSKTLSPGMRLGWAIAAPEVIQEMVVAKQAADLHTSTVEQRAAARLLEDFDYEGHVNLIRRVYGERCEAMIAAITEHFPAECRWTRPDGGLFIWVELPESVAAETLLDEAIRQKVAFVPGAPFFAAEPRHHFVRLNFSNRAPEDIRAGIQRIGRLIEGEMR